MITRQQAIDLFRSDDLVGIGMEADQIRRKLHPEGIVSYIIDRNINYTNFCTEYCSFCAFYRPMGHAEGYILSKEKIFEKIQETIDLGGTGILMQGGLHPDLHIEWYEDLLSSIRSRFNIWQHCFSAPEIVNIAEVSGLSLRDTIARLRDAGLDSIPGGGAEILDTDVRHRISRLKCSVQEWIDVAKKKDIATVAMKTMGGVGRAAQDEKFKKLLADPKYQGSTPGAAMVKWLKSNENLTAAVIATRNFDQFRENAGAAASLAMGPQDHAALSLLSGYNKGLTCLLCAQCVSSCPEHIGISDIFRYERYARDYHDLDRAQREYAALTRNGTSCVGCGDCLPTCSQEIDIAAKLKDVHRLLG